MDMGFPINLLTLAETKDRIQLKAKARLHQSKFRAEILEADFQDYGNRLAKNM